MSKQHVIFGTGPLGRAVMNELIARGERVRMVNRKGKAENMPATVEIVAGEATDPVQTRRNAAGADVIYFCVNPPYDKWLEQFPPMQAGILDAAIHTGAKFVVAENVYMYGDTDGRPLTEDLPAIAHTRKGHMRGVISQTVMDAHRAGKVRATFGRASDFFGPYVRDSLIGDRIFYPMLAGKAAQLVGNIDVPHTVTYIEDFGRLLVTLGERDEALGQIWHTPNAPAMTQRELITLAAQEAGIPPKMSSMGTIMMRLGGLFIPAARETVEMMYEFNKPFIVDSSKAEKAFGLKATPLKEAIRNTLAWYRAHPHTAD